MAVRSAGSCRTPPSAARQGHAARNPERGRFARPSRRPTILSGETARSWRSIAGSGRRASRAKARATSGIGRAATDFDITGSSLFGPTALACSPRRSGSRDGEGDCGVSYMTGLGRRRSRVRHLNVGGSVPDRQFGVPAPSRPRARLRARPCRRSPVDASSVRATTGDGPGSRWTTPPPTSRNGRVSSRSAHPARTGGGCRRTPRPAGPAVAA